MFSDKGRLFSFLVDGRFFPGVTDIELIEIINKSRTNQYRKGRAAHYQGDEADTAYLVLTGNVRKIKHRNDGTSLTTGTAMEGDWLGLPEIVSGGPYLTDAMARVDSYLLYIDKNEFMKLIEIGNFQRLVLKIMARGYYSVHSHIENISPRGKIIKFLLAHHESFSREKKDFDCYDIDITQEDLADFIGFTRETINKHLKILAVENIIKLSRGKIEIPDFEKLKSADRE